LNRSNNAGTPRGSMGMRPDLAVKGPVGMPTIPDMKRGQYGTGDMIPQAISWLSQNIDGWEGLNPQQKSAAVKRWMEMNR
jgi:hypothetical protein